MFWQVVVHRRTALSVWRRMSEFLRPSSGAAGQVRPLPSWLGTAWAALEPLWVASLVLTFVIWGYRWLPDIIQMLGRAGRTEIVEWAVYLSLLACFPVAAVFIAFGVPRLAGRQTLRTVKAGLVLLTAIASLSFAVRGRFSIVFAAMALALASLAVAKVLRFDPRRVAARELPNALLLIFVSSVSWLSAGGLVSWGSSLEWVVASPIRIIAGILALVIAARGLPSFFDSDVVGGTGPGMPRMPRIAGIAAVVLLAGFSFRTTPMVEFYHWGFYIGPIEGLRQGGWLLRDTPSQYGFLSILLPAALPGNAWQSFWAFQSILYAVVAVMMFRALRALKQGSASLLLAFLITFTALFFRPRDAELLLPAQMTPSGGPVRFVWCFVLLAFLLHEYGARAGHAGAHQRHRQFVLGGNAIWLIAVLWSFESAIYCSAIWFSACAVHLAQMGATWRDAGEPLGRIAMRIVAAAAAPFIGLAAATGATIIAYRLTVGEMPDFTGYFEYGLLYSGGFGSLPIDTSGSVWYLLVIFFAVSTAVISFAVNDARDPRLVVAAGVWGAVWSLSSYFVSRSHPVNLLSLIPPLLFAVAVLLTVMRGQKVKPWHRYVGASMVPVFAMPVVLTLGHAGFAEQLATRQLAPGRFTEQVLTMAPGLQQLLRAQGAKPGDPVVLIADGRLMLPGWSSADGTTRTMSEKSWLPKPYEIIGSLSPARRQVYLDRSLGRFRSGGWLVHDTAGGMGKADEHIAQLASTHRVLRTAADGPWLVSWYAPARSH